MSDFKKRLRSAVASAIGHNDNIARDQTARLVINGPVTIFVGNTFKKTPRVPFKRKKSDGSQAPAYLEHRRAILGNLPPYRH